MPGTHSSLLLHIVFSTKHRYPMIHESFDPELYKYIVGIVSGEGGYVLAINGASDHIHIVLCLKPKHSIPDLLRKIKANSSKWINENRKADGKFGWQTGYGVFSISESQLSKVITYVANQKAHHREKSFQVEFTGFLEKHNIDYDAQYLWD